MQRKGSCGLDEQVDEGSSGMPRSKSGDEFVSCISEDEFYENGARQSTPGPKSIFGGLSEDMDMINEDDNEAVKRGKEISHRIEELVASGAIEDVLDCFDTFQERAILVTATNPRQLIVRIGSIIRTVKISVILSLIPSRS